MGSTTDEKPQTTLMAWTALLAGLTFVAFGGLIIVIGTAAQLAEVQAVFGVGTTLALAGMGIKSDAIGTIVQSITGAKGKS
jgi:hypothetical protein